VRDSFKCGIDYHAPTDCDTIKKWLTKCADDSETANYISAHTKDVSSAILYSPLLFIGVFHSFTVDIKHSLNNTIISHVFFVFCFMSLLVMISMVMAW